MTQSTALSLFTCALTFVAGTSTIPTRVDAFQSTPANASDLLLKAKTVSVIGKTGKQMMDRAWANPNGARGKEKVVAVLSEWGRYQILEDPDTVDLILVVTEVQKNLNLLKRANLVAELKVYPGGMPVTEQTPVLWSGDAGESFRKMPSTQVAEKFRDYVVKLETSNSGAPRLAQATAAAAMITLANGDVIDGSIQGRVLTRRSDADGNVTLRVLDGKDISSIDETGVRATGESAVLAGMKRATQDDVLQGLIFWNEGRRLKKREGLVRDVGTAQVVGLRVDNAMVKSAPEDFLGEYRIDEAAKKIELLFSVRLKKRNGDVITIQIAEIARVKQ